MEPILGFRAWSVFDGERRSVIKPKDLLKAAAGSHIVNPEIDTWLARKLFGDEKVLFGDEKEPKKPARLRAEPGTLRSTGYVKGSSIWREPNSSYRFSCSLGHEQPDFNCSCGLYACLTVQDAIRRGPDVVGAVIAWGHVVLHGIQGFRAEYMRIVAIAAKDRSRSEKARLASDRYGVSLVDLDSLELVGREFGRPITWSYDGL